MRLAFISDIHGNATALESVLSDINKRKIDKVYVLGDLCFRGIEPQRSLDLVIGLNTEVIKGNADEWIVRGIEKDEVKDQAVEIMTRERDWTYSHLDKESIEYLQNLPTSLNVEYEGYRIHLFHATPDSLFEVVQPSESDDLLRRKLLTNEADIYIYAHIHKPFTRFVNGKCLVNTGSVGMPFDGNNKSSYVIVEIDGESFNVSIIRVKYDIEKVIATFSESDYPNRDLLEKILLHSKI